MTRKPDPKSNMFLNLKARTESEKKLFSDFKALALQDEADQMDLFAEAVQHLFTAHHWPPGNPQLTLTNYQVKPVSLGHCGYVGCKAQAVGSGVYLPQNKEYKLCGLHRTLAQNTPKVWRL